VKLFSISRAAIDRTVDAFLRLPLWAVIPLFIVLSAILTLLVLMFFYFGAFVFLVMF